MNCQVRKVGLAKKISPNRIIIIGIMVFGISSLMYVALDQTSSLTYDFQQLKYAPTTTSGGYSDVEESNDISCKVSASSYLIDIDGNSRDTKSAFSIIEDPVATYNFFDVETGKQSEKIKVVPKIKCKSDNNIILKPSEFSFFIESQNSKSEKINTFNGVGRSNQIVIESANLLGIKTGDYSIDYELMQFDVPVQYILKFLDDGTYSSWQEIFVQSNLELYVENQPERVLTLEIPKKVGVGEDIRTWFEIRVEKDTGKQPEPEQTCQPPNMIVDGECQLPKSNGGTSNGGTSNGGTSNGGTSNGDIVKPIGIIQEFLNYLVTGDIDSLTNVNFYPFYVAGIGGIVLLSIFSSRSRQVVYYG